MIVTEHNIRAIIETIPAIRINDSTTTTPSFGWGDKAELSKYLKNKKGSAYPLIWLLPSADSYSGNGQQVDKDCVFVIAQRETEQDMYNDERYINSFATILNPLTARLIHGLDVSTISNLSDREWVINKFPNYAEADKNYTIDLWDAVQLTISVRFNNTSDCLKAISYG
jgi:hypothetical protein